MHWDHNVVIKNAQELSLLREAGRVTAQALAAIREAAKPGVTTAELDKIATEIIYKAGGTPTFKNYPGAYPYPATICASVNEELVHGIPSKRKLCSGDILSVDCGTTLNGFVGDAAITVGIGDISEQAEQLLQVTEQALWEGIRQMCAGNKTGDVSAAIQRFVEGQGFYVTREYTGHGVGRRMHEGPQVPNYGRPGRGLALRPGMTIALEPMVLIGTEETHVLPDQWTVSSADGSLTAHFEHSVAVTDGEPMILTLP